MENCEWGNCEWRTANGATANAGKLQALISIAAGVTLRCRCRCTEADQLYLCFCRSQTSMVPPRSREMNLKHDFEAWDRRMSLTTIRSLILASVFWRFSNRVPQLSETLFVLSIRAATTKSSHLPVTCPFALIESLEILASFKRNVWFQSLKSKLQISKFK